MILYLSTIDKTICLKLFSLRGELLNQSSWETDINHSKELLVGIDAFLSQNGLNKNDLSGVVVLRGPGSYTGLRVGVTTANVLAFALNIPVVGICSDTTLIDHSLLDELSRSSSFSKAVFPIYADKPHITQRKN